MTKIKLNVSISFFLYIVLIIINTTINTINAQETATDTPPKIVTLPGPNVKGIPETTKDPNSDYAKLLAYSLYFYEAQRSGVLPTTNRVPWRHDSALTDGFNEGVDLTGGYYDAGDYMKFTLPLSWTLTSISWGGLEWYEGYELSEQTEYLHDMVKWGTDWLIQAHSLITNELYVQVGIDTIDHNYWGTDMNIPLPRPAYKVGGLKHGTDVASDAVAAFASASILFKEKYSNLTYSNELLLHAITLYQFAEQQEWKLYSDNVPQVKNLYGTINYQDKLVWAALWLYKATGQEIYLNKAKDYFKTFGLQNSKQIINWADHTCATYFLFVQLTNGTNSLDELSWKLEAEKYLDFMINPQNPCFYTPGGLLWCDDDSASDSLNIPINIAFVALLYAPYATSIEKSIKYKDFAQSQIMYVLGKNPMEMPYVIGISPKSPKNPHHAGAHGSTTNNLSQPLETTNIIYGAVVGGPSRNDFYIDDRTLYDFSEVALDYNAPWQGLMAYQVIKYKPDAQPIPTTPTTPGENGKGNNNNGAPKIGKTGGTIGITIGSILLGIFLLLGVLFIWKRSMIFEWLKKRSELNRKITNINNENSRPNSTVSPISRTNSAVISIRSNSVNSPISRPNSADLDPNYLSLQIQ